MVSQSPAENSSNQESTAGQHTGEGWRKNPDSPSPDFAVLIQAIKDEGAAYRKEEQREDRSKKFREWLTIILLFCTMGAIFWQVHEMIKVYEPISEQAKAAVEQAKSSEKSLISAQRAWVGPRLANIATEPTVGKPVEISIEYQNTGRDPALGFRWFVEPFIASLEEDTNGAAGKRIDEYMKSCRAGKDWPGGSVIYPGTSGLGSAGYTLMAKTKDDFVDEALLKGEKVVIVQGCFWYLSFEIPRHSYFCYYWKKDQTKIANLNICLNGHYAD